MPVFYYIDFYYDTDVRGLGGVVDGCVKALLDAGCALNKVVMSTEGMSKQVSLGEHVMMGPGDIGKFASTYADEMLSEGQRLISFPPMGRILLEYGFRFDESVREEMEDEEAETRSSARLIGLNFTAGDDQAAGRKIKASMSLWEEYVLTHGDREINRYNMKKLLDMVLLVYERTGPYFGAMNNELRLNTDGAYELLEEGLLPQGNEFALIGSSRMDRLAPGALERSGLKWRDLPDGGVLIQFQDRWAGREKERGALEL